MQRLHRLAIAFCLRISVLLIFGAVAGTDAWASSRSFGAGSFIIPADYCWQPNYDTPAGTPAAYCDPNKNDQSIFQMYGMLYAILDVGDNPNGCLNNDGTVPMQKALFGYCKQVKIYWLISNTKTDPQAPDLTLADPTASATKPMVTIYNSTKKGTVAPISNYVTKGDSGAATSISYAGGPFVIDVNDLTAEEMDAIKARFPSVRIHRANIPFTGNVDRVLVGKPPKIAVLNEGASDVLESYIRASGSLSWRNTVFQYVGARDVLAGCLEEPPSAACMAKRSDITSPFQLLWAPHWLVSGSWEDGAPTVADQQTVVRKVRDFLERGNSGLFECASIESIEGSATGGTKVGSAGGFTIGSNQVLPRIDTNGGCSDTGKCTTPYFKYELPSFWLTQCGGWSYKATGGHVHNLRPSMLKSYSYLTTRLADDPVSPADERYVGSQLTRFIHDDPAKVKGSYAAGSGGAANYFIYDYLIGGRINGSPTQGYVVYLPGHSYIKCGNNSSTTYPPSRTVSLQFTAAPPAGGSIYVEAQHQYCILGSTCPKVAFDLASASGTSASDANLDLSVEFASFDQATNTLSGVTVTSNNPYATSDLRITNLHVTFDGNGGAVRLANIVDLTGTDRKSLCAPGQTSSLSPASPVHCADTAPASLLSLTFSGGVTSATNKAVTVTIPSSSGQVSASYDTGTKMGTVSSSGNLTLDMRSAVYDKAANSLSGIVIKRGTNCSDVTLTDIKVGFGGSGTVTGVYNDTTSELLCAPNHATVASCSGANPSGWSYLLGRGICSYYVSPYLSSCTVNWGSSNTCGIKFFLNTFMAVKYQMPVSSEYTKTQPLVQDNILYQASYDYPAYRGHLKMIKVPTDTQPNAATVWDAAGSMPPAGTTSFPGAPLSSTDTTSPRYIFTTLPGSTTHINFDPDAFALLDSVTKGALRTQLGAGSDNEAIVTIQTVRGRKSASTADVYSSTSSCTGARDGVADVLGCDEDGKRLWAIEKSTPALKVKSRYVESTAPPVSAAAIAQGRDRRDRILFAGGDDGMMHAFWGGTFDPVSGTYPDTAAGNGTGKEIWAYLPSSLLGQLKNQPFNPDPTNEATFDPKVSVDGSPALSDFLVCSETEALTGACSKWEWKTRLVGTAMVRSQNRGIVFALDVTDPYQPQLLWETTYDIASDTACAGTSKNCNMGNSNGVAIGAVQIGTQINDYVFLTSSWIERKKPATVNPLTNEYIYTVCAPTDPSPSCVYGVSAYALDLDTGKVIWERSLPYDGDAAGINETPAVPALMDRDNNGSYDYVVFGDMQGRVWALRTTDGKNLTDRFSATVHASEPVYRVAGGEGAPTGAKEPIGAPVAVYRDYVVLGTGGADFASSGSPTDVAAYRVEIIKIGVDGAVRIETVPLTGYDSATKKGSEKVWSKPAITSDLKVYIGTARSYFDSRAVSSLQSDGRVMVIDLRVKPDLVKGVTNVSFVGTGIDQWYAGGFVGGFDFDHKHAYVATLTPILNRRVLQIGAKTDFSSTRKRSNNYKILWWRKL